MSTSYAAGLAFGIVTALLIYAIVRKITGKAMKGGSFDERQELVRGRGYKYAFFVLLWMLVLDLLLESFDAFEALPVSRTLAVFTMLLAGVMIYALYCIKNDSYFGIGADTRVYRVVMWLVIIINGISGFMGLKDGAMVDGKLSFRPCASLLFCLAFIIVMISISAKQRSIAEEEASEDDM